MRARFNMKTGIALIVALTFSPAAASAQTAQKPATSKPAAPATQKPATQTPSAAKPAAAKPAAPSAALRTPSKLKETAPPVFNVAFDTTAGPFVVKVTRAWAPRGADRFYNLVKHGYFDNGRFFRVVPNFMVQFGINGDPATQKVWREANINDDPVTQSNKRGFITFANRGPNTRSTQLFINFKDNAFLDDRFSPFGQVISGMEAVDKINAAYGEKPDQFRIQSEGNAYLTKEFPKLDYIRKATIQKPTPPPPPPPPVKKK
jgi:peptidyl-prolyl cis-trans isomerase A (cyclophilin A)